jgi:prolyl 4-hydroxylase
MSLSPATDQALSLYQAAGRATQENRLEEAVELLKQAVALGSDDARVALGRSLLHGIGTEADHAGAYALFVAAAEARVTEAMLTAAVLEARGIGTDAHWDQACQRMVLLARSGYAAALRQLGIMAWMAGSGADQASLLLRHAMIRGDLMAAAALARLASQGQPCGVSPSEARFLADLCQRAQHPSAQAIQSGLPLLSVEPKGPQEQPNWDAVLAAVCALREPPGVTAGELLAHDPDIFHYRSFFSAIECDYVMGMTSPLLTVAKIFDPSTGTVREDPYRRSMVSTPGPLDQDLVWVALDQRICKATGLPVSQGEMLSVLVYGPGHEYKAHRDYIIDDGGSGTADLARGGQRVATLLVGLADSYLGGETVFPLRDISVQLSRGDALLFWNVDATGQEAPSTLHEGKPVSQGVKWLASKWMRSGVYTW